MMSRAIRSRRATLLFTLLAALLACLAPARAQTAPTPGGPAPVQVGIYESPPFVMRTGHGYGGMAIDLWEASASKLGLQFTYRPMATLSALLDAVAAGQVDVAVANLSITQDRAARMDFTQPWFDSGLRLMVDENRHEPFWSLVDTLRQSGHLRVYGWIAGIILAATVLLTMVDRRIDPDFTREWGHGLAESFYQVMSIATSGKASHKQLFGPWGRVLAAVWMVCGVGVVAYVTSSITSAMTANAINREVHNIGDLHGKTAGVIKGSFAEDYAENAAISVRGYDNLAAAVKGLLGRQVVAIIGDAPVLEYYDNTHPDLPITEVGALFRPDKYGFALPHGSGLEHDLTLQILAARETGLLERLRSKYFGVTP